MTSLAPARATAAVTGSLVPFLRGQAPAVWRQVVLLEQFGYPPAPPRGSELLEPPDSLDGKKALSYPAFRGLRTADSKFVEYATGEREVYNLSSDPDELVNLRNRVPKKWMAGLSALASSLGACAGETCRQIELQPVPPLPAQ